MQPRSAVRTIEAFVLDQERKHPEATGELTNLLYDIALGTKVVGAAIRRAGLMDILGRAGAVNIQGEEQMKLDVFANESLKSALHQAGRVSVMASEEDPEPTLWSDTGDGKYAVLIDPLDGSSNIDVNGAVGTIFSIYRRVSKGKPSVKDVLQPGRHQVAAGYVMYGSSVMLVYTTGNGVHGFTLDPTIGEFVLSHEGLRFPERGVYLSVNESNFYRWSRGMQRAVRAFHGEAPEAMKAKNSRYIGSLVADFHRNLIAGGIFLYPGDSKNPNGKLRLSYEANPMAMIAEHAGGAATNGLERILDITPVELHQRTPLVIGSKLDVEFVTRTLRETPA
jgi:fructose-1,6-bisphosphatase I